MEMRNTNRAKTRALIVYVVAFYIVWTAWEFWGKSFLDGVIQNAILLQFVKSGVIKNLAWTFPALLLISHFESDVCISLKEMFTAKVLWHKYLPIYLIFTVYLLAGRFLTNGKLEISGSFGFDDMIIVLFVGLTEETVFRAWLLNATFRENKRWIYIVVNALMFLAIHFPKWISSGTFISNFTGLGFISILVLSVIFSWTFVKSRNIIIPITLHMYWDLLMLMFY